MKKNLLVLMSGSIAAYKTCDVISYMTQRGWRVRVAMSSGAQKFLGTATIEGLSGSAPLLSLYDSGKMMSHIHAMREADIIVAAPATANFINRISAGIADDLITSMTLAHDFKKPFLIAPAMNTMMLLNPATQKSIANLKHLGFEFIKSEVGTLACGEHGDGRLASAAEILKAIFARAPRTGPLAGKKVLITSGGTREPVDSVRAITNLSTGGTGETIAAVLADAGAEVTQLAGRSSKTALQSQRVLTFDTFKEVQVAIRTELKRTAYDFVIHAAAISDFSVKDFKEGKLTSSKDQKISLLRNPKLLPEIRTLSKNSSLKIVGFKLTAHADRQMKREKIESVLKHCDWVVYNDTAHFLPEHEFEIFAKTPTTKSENPPPQKLASLKGSRNLANHLLKLFVEEAD